MKNKNLIRFITAIILLGFGLVTLFLSTSIIFDLFEIRAKEGNYVLFIVWSNFISSLLYLLSVYGFIKKQNWTKILLSAASIILIISFLSLKIHISNGGVYETKTVLAMIFRISLTLIITLIAYFTITKDKINELEK